MRRLVSWMARHGVAANLLMALLLIAGTASVFLLEQEVFPEFALDTIQVRVDYPGASPEEIEQSILTRIEERVDALDDVDEVRSLASEGVGLVTVELVLGSDSTDARSRVEAEVNRIASFPEEAERPVVTELTNRRRVLRLVLHGDVDSRVLKRLAYGVEDGLSRLPAVQDVRVDGVPTDEIDIRVSRDALRSLGLTLPEIAATVGQNSLDLPAGTLETDEQDIVVRTEGRRQSADDYRDLVVLASADGGAVRLSDVATIEDGPSTRGDLEVALDGQPAVYVDVFRTDGQRVLSVVDAALQHVDEVVRPSLPPAVTLSVWQNEAETLQSRLSLLVRNGAIGLVLVLLALGLVLRPRVAFWVAVGIAVSFLGAFGVLYLLGESINQLSLFGFILAIGIVVDDAIIVGENVFAERERGRPPGEAAVEGAQRVLVPVTFAVTTTVVAFLPLLVVPGTIGKITRNIPIVVISVLVLSLVESLLVLPYHLGHSGGDGGLLRPIGERLTAIRESVGGALRRFTDGPLDRFVRSCVARPGWTIATGIAALLLVAGLVAGGWLRFQFLPSIEGNSVRAMVQMPAGTPAERTREVATHLREAGHRAGDRLGAGLVEHVLTSVGDQPSAQGGPDGPGADVVDPTIAEVAFELVDADARETPARDFEAAWRDEAGEVSGVRSLTFASELIQLGAPVEVALSADDPGALERAVRRVRTELEGMAGVVDVRDDRGAGRPEIELRLREAARTLGITLQALASQVRGAFFGTEALRLQRGREEVRVYVRLPEEERDGVEDLRELGVRTPRGGLVPLASVASVEMSTGPSTLRREQGRRVVSVTADVVPSTTTGQEVSDRLRSGVLAELGRDVPGFSASFGGEQEAQAEALTALAQAFALALLVMYALLAIPFRSYTLPFVILGVIPFGLVGAAAGHAALGLPITILSLFGIVGLSGVIVNDALVMVDFVLEAREDGASPADAIVSGAKQRFRPILLTSVTTFLGLAPIILEPSVQARFLVPMAVSLGFGILLGTVVLMALVPALARLYLGCGESG